MQSYILNLLRTICQVGEYIYMDACVGTSLIDRKWSIGKRFYQPDDPV